MKRVVHRCLVAVALACASSPEVFGRAGQSPRELYERGRVLEENTRTLPRALETYEQVAAAARGDRPLAAAARLRIAFIKERQGRPEARALFAAIVRDYADQPEAVAMAKARLSATVARQSEAAPRRLPNSLGFPSAISPDGRRAVVVTDEKISRMALQDQETGSVTTLVQGSELGWGRAPLFSPDGRRVVYSWLQLDRPRSSPPTPNATTSLRVIGTEPGAVAKAIGGPINGFFGHVPAGWSPDGTAILCWISSGPSAPVALAWISVADGIVNVIKRLEPWRNVFESGGQGPGFRQLSPDGRYVAYSANPREGSEDRYIYVADLAGQMETTIVGMAGLNTRPLWTPDGSALMFVNLQSGNRSLWAVGVHEGRVSMDPWMVRANFAGSLVDIASNSGDLVYSTIAETGFSEYVAERDPSGARVVQVFKGIGGTWSKGNRFAFLRPQRPLAMDASPFDLIVRRMDTGEERAYQHPGLSNVSPRWFGDDSAVIVYVQGTPKGTSGSFYRVDLSSGTFTELFKKDTATHVRGTTGAVSNDNKTMYLAVRASAEAPWTGIVAVDLTTGAERPVAAFPSPGLPGRSGLGVVLSPDGTTLAMSVWAADGSQNGRLITVRTDGTDFREVFAPVVGGGWTDVLRWTPDGQSLLFSSMVTDATGARTWRIMRVAATGGTAEFDGLESANLTTTSKLPDIEKSNISGFDVSPDGSRLAFSSRAITSYEVWSLDNVLALLKR